MTVLEAILLISIIGGMSVFAFGFLRASFTTSTNTHLIMEKRDRDLCVGAVIFMASVIIILGAITFATM